MTKLEELRCAYTKVPKQDWTYDPTCAAVVYVDGHKVRCAADLGKIDSAAPFGKFIVLAHNLMPTLLEAIDLLETVSSARACQDHEFDVDAWFKRVRSFLEKLK